MVADKPTICGWLRVSQLADMSQEDFQRRTTGSVGDHLNFVELIREQSTSMPGDWMSNWAIFS